MALSYAERQSILGGAVLPRSLAAPLRAPVVYEGRAQVEVVDPDGKVKGRAEGWNAAVTYGMSRLADYIATYTGSASTWMGWMAIGTGTDAPTSTQASLIASTGSSTGVVNQSVAAARTARYTTNFASNNPAGTATINEVGLFQTNTFSGSMGARATLSPAVTKGASDTINVKRWRRGGATRRDNPVNCGNPKPLALAA